MRATTILKRRWMSDYVGLLQVQRAADAARRQPCGQLPAYAPHLAHRQPAQQQLLIVWCQPVPAEDALALRPCLGHVVGQLGQRFAAANAHAAGDADALQHVGAKVGRVLALFGNAVQVQEAFVDAVHLLLHAPARDDLHHAPAHVTV